MRVRAIKAGESERDRFTREPVAMYCDIFTLQKINIVCGINYPMDWSKAKEKSNWEREFVLLLE